MQNDDIALNEDKRTSARDTCLPLARTVVRAFYSDESAIVFDALVHQQAKVKDSDIAIKLSLSVKAVRITLQKMKLDGLISGISQKQTNTRQKMTQMLWFFDHERFIKVFRFRMIMMRKASGANSQLSAPEEEFFCTDEQCYYRNRKFTKFEVIAVAQRLQRTDFSCEHCNSPLTQSSESIETLGANEDIKILLNTQLRSIEARIKEAVKIIAQEHIDLLETEKQKRLRDNQSSGRDRRRWEMTSDDLTGNEVVNVTIESEHKSYKRKRVAVTSSQLNNNTTGTNSEIAKNGALENDSNTLEKEANVEDIFAHLAVQQEHCIRQNTNVPAAKLLSRKRTFSDTQTCDTASAPVVSVFVAGESVALLSLTEHHFRVMTDSEYENYVTMAEQYGLDCDNSDID